MAAEKRTPDEYELLRNLIISGQVQPNERLVETDYAERLGTNRRTSAARWRGWSRRGWSCASPSAAPGCAW
jgi:hypothetical protein